MYNYFMLIGRVCKDIEIREVGDGKKVVNLLLAVNRDFKNVDGGYDTDFFYITMWEFLADQAKEQAKKGSLIGIKGRILPRVVELKDGPTLTLQELIGERIVFFADAASAQKFASDSGIEG